MVDNCHKTLQDVNRIRIQFEVSHPLPVVFVQYELYNVLCCQNTTVFKKWYMEYYTINYVFLPLYIGHPQVFLKVYQIQLLRLYQFRIY
jgi:hypothetical protein